MQTAFQTQTLFGMAKHQHDAVTLLGESTFSVGSYRLPTIYALIDQGLIEESATSPIRGKNGRARLTVEGIRQLAHFEGGRFLNTQTAAAWGMGAAAVTIRAMLATCLQAAA